MEQIEIFHLSFNRTVLSHHLMTDIVLLKPPHIRNFLWGRSWCGLWVKNVTPALVGNEGTPWFPPTILRHKVNCWSFVGCGFKFVFALLFVALSQPCELSGNLPRFYLAFKIQLGSFPVASQVWLAGVFEKEGGLVLKQSRLLLTVQFPKEGE